MSGYRSVQPPRTTSIENFLDLNEIMSGGGAQQKGISSLDGYPPPQHVNGNFVDQLTTENYERDVAMKPIQNKIRSTNPEQLQLAMNGGMPIIQESYLDDIQLGPVARQNLAKIRENYQEAPKPYPQHPSVPKNSAQLSNYQESYVVPQAQFNCLDVANHIQKCPLCSKFYDNDRSMYWAAIVLLALACLYLLKRVMDAKRQ